MERFINFDLTKVYTSADLDTPSVMERFTDASGNKYVFLTGVASTVVGSVVTYDEAGVSTLLVANAIGPVAIAMALTVASTSGWYMTEGSTSGKVSASFADNGNCYATATAGQVDDAVVAGDRVKNMIGRSAISGGLATLQIWSPFMDDGLSA